jgi:hypothetical protein
MNVSLNEIDEPIVVLNLAQSSMQKERVGIAANKDEAERSKLNSKYFQPKLNSVSFVALVVRKSSKKPRTS